MTNSQRKRRKAQRIFANAGPVDLIAFDAAITIDAADAEKKGPRRYEMLAYSGGALRVGTYPLPVVIDLDGMEFRTAKLPIYFGHHDGSDGSKLVGHTDSHDKSGGKLIVAGAISAATQNAREVVETHDNGYQWQASVGVLPDKSQLEEVRAGKSVTVNGRTFTGPLIVARKSVLRHVAILPEGADAQTHLSIAAQAANTHKEESMDFQNWLNALFGGEVPELSDKQKATLLARYDAEKEAAPVIEGKAAAGPAAPTFDVNEIVTMHAKYVATIEGKAGEYAEKVSSARLGEIQAAARTKAATLKLEALNGEKPAAWLEVALVKAQAETEGELFKAGFSTTPAIHGSNRDTSAEVIEAAFCGAAGLRNLEKTYKPEVLEAAAAYRRRDGVSLQGIILAAACESGYSGSARTIHRGNYDEVMRHVLGGMIQAASSTHSLTTMLSTVGNKFLLDGFSTVEQVWREFAYLSSVNDFKAMTGYRMLDGMVFEEIGADGEIKHGTLSQESYTNQARTYAKMLTLTRQDIINNDLGAFNTIRQRIGRGSGIKLNQVFWTAFLDDSTFFTTGDDSHLNLLTAVLGESGLSEANVLLKSKTDGYGNPIDIGGEHVLLTGPTLTPTARKWYVSQEIRDTTASTKTPTTNIYQNMFRPVESRYVTSTTAWYLLPVGGGDMAPMEVCFLDGVQAPTIESADADFNTLGIQFRGYFDFGVARKEWRASVKSTGAG